MVQTKQPRAKVFHGSDFLKRVLNQHWHFPKFVGAANVSTSGQIGMNEYHDFQGVCSLLLLVQHKTFWSFSQLSNFNGFSSSQFCVRDCRPPLLAAGFCG